VFVSAYVPIAIVIGYWHRKTQWRVEQQALFKENEIGATMWLFVIDLIDGKVSDEEKQQMRDMLHKIVRKPPRATEKTGNQKHDRIDRPTEASISDYKEPRIEQGQK